MEGRKIPKYLGAWETTADQQLYWGSPLCQEKIEALAPPTLVRPFSRAQAAIIKKIKEEKIKKTKITVNKREVSGEAGMGASTKQEGGGPRASEATYPAGVGFRRGETPGVKRGPGCSGGKKGRHEGVPPLRELPELVGGGPGGTRGTRTPQGVAHAIPALGSRSTPASPRPAGAERATEEGYSPPPRRGAGPRAEWRRRRRGLAAATAPGTSALGGRRPGGAEKGERSGERLSQ